MVFPPFLVNSMRTGTFSIFLRALVSALGARLANSVKG